MTTVANIAAVLRGTRPRGWRLCCPFCQSSRHGLHWEGERLVCDAPHCGGILAGTFELLRGARDDNAGRLG